MPAMIPWLQEDDATKQSETMWTRIRFAPGFSMRLLRNKKGRPKAVRIQRFVNQRGQRVHRLANVDWPRLPASECGLCSRLAAAVGPIWTGTKLGGLPTSSQPGVAMP